jgi:SAM-dependent methyltransferase
MGADHAEWARHHPALLVGLDFTSRALDHTKARLHVEGCESRLLRADAEQLPFADGSFELVYSWGVLHHSPDTPQAIREVHRVLAPGGIARVMIYHRSSIVGSLLWLRYALLRGRPGRTLQDIYATHLESPGTKAYSMADANELFSVFRRRSSRPMLSFADLLDGAAGKRHGALMLRIARKLWPRWAIRRWLATRGLYLLVEAVK